MKLSFWLVLSVLALVSLACAPSVLFEATPELLPPPPTAAAVPPKTPTTAAPPTAAPPTAVPPTAALPPTAYPTAAPALPATQPNSLSNTRWQGIDSDGDQINWYLMPNGIVEYANPDTYYRNGTWTLDGDSFSIETNNHFADYTGTLSEDTLSGSAKNVKNSTWNWSLQKVETCVNFCGQTWANLYNTAWLAVSGSYLRLYFKSGEVAFQTAQGDVDHSGSYEQNKAKLTLDLSPTYADCSAEMRGDSIFLTCGSTSWILQQIKAW